jgi:hypothetical protein
MNLYTLPDKKDLIACYEREMHRQGQDFLASKTVDTIAKFANGTLGGLNNVAELAALEFAKNYEHRTQNNLAESIRIENQTKSDVFRIKKALMQCTLMR